MSIEVPIEGRNTKETAGSESLIGVDGNAFGILGHVKKQLARAGASSWYQNEYYTQATSGDYDNLLAVSVAYLDAEPLDG